jgi:hypothetical protein
VFYRMQEIKLKMFDLLACICGDRPFVISLNLFYGVLMCSFWPTLVKHVHAWLFITSSTLFAECWTQEAGSQVAYCTVATWLVCTGFDSYSHFLRCCQRRQKSAKVCVSEASTCTVREL